MKKFLAILLIAIVACSEVSVIEEEEFDLESFKGAIQNAIAWLKNHGLWDPILNLLKTAGKAAAYALCTNYVKSNVCNVINNL